MQSMKKNLIAVAVLAAFAGVAHAQSNIQIYGLLDTGYIKEGGTDARMGSKTESRIGFMGSEDLGGGMKATFQLEKRFNLNDGTLSGSTTADTNSARNTWNADDGLHGRANGEDWKGAANLGLSGNWGAIRFGRVANIGTEYYNAIDPFGEYSVGDSFTGSGGMLYSEHFSNHVRYDSPDFAGFSFGVGFVPKSDDDTIGEVFGKRNNYGWDVGMRYARGPLLLLATHSRLADSNSSQAWNVGAAYTFGDVTVSLGYQRTDAKLNYFTYANSAYSQYDKYAANGSKQKEAILGVKWNIGPGTVDLSYNYANYQQGSYDEDAWKLAAGYTYNFSKRTAIYGMVSYTQADDEMVGAVYNTNHAWRESVAAFQVGMTHRF
ncbi:MAG: porin [Burkholderiaceae bacterium]|nr:porin [Burkholderiaceae bacterium]